MKSLFVKPYSEGLIVPNPDRAMKTLDAAGEYVPASAFWFRRLAAKDVFETEPVPEAVPAEDPAPKAGE